MYCLITGAAGLVGSALRRALPGDVVALSHSDLDVTDEGGVHKTIDKLRPEVVFNCAVMEVDACERDPDAARRLNTDGPRYLAEASNAIGATIVHFSSNYVFDGERDPSLPYTQEDLPTPVNVYGVTKWAGEERVSARNARSFIVRTSWVYGPGKNSFLSTVGAKLRRGERVQAISDTFANTTYVEDLVARVLVIVQRGTFGTYHVVNSGTCTYETFAREAARVARIPADRAEALIEVVSEADMRRVARRPRSTPMRCLLSEQIGLAPLRPWQDALADWMSLTAG